MNKWKWGLILGLIIAAMWGGCEYGIRSVLKRTDSDTTVLRDTVTVTYEKIRDTVINRDVVKIAHHTEYDTLWPAPEVIIEPVDTAVLMKDYYAARIYSDTQKLTRGQVIIDDTVSRNRITGRAIKVTGADTVIKNTVIFHAPKRAVGYFTLSGMGNAKNPGAGVGAGFGLKLPNDRLYQVEYKLVNGSRPVIEGRVFFPIRLLKRK